MTDNVIRLHPESVGEGFRFDCDDILETAKGPDLTNVVVLGEMPDGTTWVSSAANAGEALILMERAKRLIVFGEQT